jgi:hypothetical protein
MFIPGQQLPREISQFMIQALNDSEVKAELHKQIRVEIDNQRTKTGSYNGSVQSYDSLTSGNVNMQAKMAASGYDVYGRTIIGANYNASNQNTYKKMKNKIKYGKSPENGYMNRGSFSIA